ncbi:hypothetical protein LTR15_007673 [Elasticomyces elasticus]|nr:hypothetical protein LTR15_007673 [Elasticomyces elasticus]
MQKTDKSIVTAPAKRKPRKSGYKRRLFTKEEDFRLAELVERESDEKTIQEAFPDRGRATFGHSSADQQAEMRKQLEEERRGSQMLEDGDGEDRDQLLEEENLSPV